MIKPCGLVCAAYLYALAVLCPIASVALLIALLPASSLFAPLLPTAVTEFHRSSAKMALLGSERRGC